MQIFMKPSGDGVLNGVFYCMGGESSAQPLSEACGATTVIMGMAGQLSDSSSRSHATECSFSKSRMFPMVPVRMGVRRLGHRGICSRQRNG
jgi:hypothetical protein